MPFLIDPSCQLKDSLSSHKTTKTHKHSLISPPPDLGSFVEAEAVAEAAAYFDDVLRRAGRDDVLSREGPGAPGNVDDLRVGPDEHDVEGDRRVGHPELARGFVGKEKEHTLGQGHLAAIHQAGLPGRSVFGNFDLDGTNDRAVQADKLERAVFAKRAVGLRAAGFVIFARSNHE